MDLRGLLTESGDAKASVVAYCAKIGTHFRPGSTRPVVVKFPGAREPADVERGLAECLDVRAYRARFAVRDDITAVVECTGAGEGVRGFHHRFGFYLERPHEDDLHGTTSDNAFEMIVRGVSAACKGDAILGGLSKALEKVREMPSDVPDRVRDGWTRTLVCVGYDGAMRGGIGSVLRTDPPARLAGSASTFRSSYGHFALEALSECAVPWVCAKLYTTPRRHELQATVEGALDDELQEFVEGFRVILSDAAAADIDACMDSRKMYHGLHKTIPEQPVIMWAWHASR